ncbi:MAG: phage tail protein [Roseburia sp.]
MGQIGSFGPIVFEVSDKRILTLSNIKQQISAQYGEHKLINKKPQKEYLGAGARVLKFTIILDVMLGVKPKDVLRDMEYLTESGFTDYLVIGNRTVGSNKFCITDLSEAWDAVYSGGELARATMDITMEEYE